jgi:hypothetical protein
MPVQKCETCKFIVVGLSTTGTGSRCHRFPPQGYNPGTARAIFPVVQDEDICGEWKLSSDAIEKRLSEIEKQTRGK